MTRPAARPRVLTLGETMALMRTEGIGSLAHAHHLALGIGGAESNLAIGLARAGIDVTWVSRVGADALGERVLREVRAEGVDVRAAVDPDAPTGLMIKAKPTSATTTVQYFRAGSAASRMTSADVPDELLAAASLLHVGGVTTLLSPGAAATVEDAVRRARAAGVAVSFDVNHRPSLAPPGGVREVYTRLAAGADVVFGGLEELALIAPEGTDPEDPEALLRALDAHLEALSPDGAGTGGRELVAKLGGDGAASLIDGHLTRHDGFTVPVVDTVGAGDAFVAGYLAARLAGADPAERLLRGNAHGALLCMSPGDWESAPRPADLQRFLDPDGDPVSR
ncbi:sugar kinase [Brachybacterium phenoliresistens]|uniref:sugar kinase n=1 Tax=Brachybacterium phenoliresistens TaxID=396014 RepID=UPI0031E0B579